MDLIEAKFAKLGCDNAPGQEKLQKAAALELRGEPISGTPVDFSHGDVDAHPPIPGAQDAFNAGYQVGGKQAYTEYRGGKATRADLAQKLSAYSGSVVDPDKNLILTPGTQGALFLAMGSLVARGDRVAIVEPDYFANRKLVEFFEGELVPVRLNYEDSADKAGLDLEQLEQAFASGVKLFLFSNPNNPTGVIYTREEVKAIGELASKYGVFVLADELYSRQIFDGRTYTHLAGLGVMDPEKLLTIIGPSKTESLSGYRLGVAYGSSTVITRMEKLQAIVSLRCAGYCQAVFQTWFNEPDGWMADRIAQHQAIRDDLCAVLREGGLKVRTTEGGSYLFAEMPELDVSIGDFAKIVRQLAGVTVTPGTEFGPQFTHHFRLNFSQNHAAAVEAVKRLIEVMNRYRKA